MIPKTALITGAAGGIGRALVSVFHHAGYQVIATDRVAVPCDCPGVQPLLADLARYAEDEAYASEINAALHAALAGSLEVLINNAAVQILGGVDDLTRHDWQSTLGVNVLAPFLLTQSLLPALEQAQGCVINISSIHAKLTKKHFVAYATSKAALSGMTRAMAVDMGHRVRVNAIEPAAIETEMLKAGFAGKPERYAELAACHPQGRLGQADEVAQLALAIAEGGMGFLQGACIGLDGGIRARLFDPD